MSNRRARPIDRTLIQATRQRHRTTGTRRHTMITYPSVAIGQAEYLETPALESGW